MTAAHLSRLLHQYTLFPCEAALHWSRLPSETTLGLKHQAIHDLARRENNAGTLNL